MRLNLVRLQRRYPLIPDWCDVSVDGFNVYDHKHPEPISIGLYCRRYSVLLLEFVNEIGRHLELKAQLMEGVLAAQPVNRETPIRLKTAQAALTAVSKPLKSRKRSSSP